MKRASLVFAGVLLAVAVLALAGGPPPTEAATQAVSMGDNFFGPDALTVAVGDTVTWSNDGAVPHTATAQGAFDTDILMSGESFSYTFSSAGTFDYICLVHPGVMTGSIVVQEAAPAPVDAGNDSNPPAQPASQAVEPAAPAAAGQNLPTAGFGPGVVNRSGGGWAIAAGAALLALGALGAGAAMMRPRRS